MVNVYIMEKKKVKIYVLINPETNKTHYVGRSVNPAGRYRVHIHLSRRSKRKNKKDAWICSLLNKGIKPQMKIIEEVINDKAIEREKFWIKELRKTCDLKNARDYIENNYLFSEESRKKMSESAKGNTCKRGTKLSKETKKLIAESKKGFKHSEESKKLTSKIVLQFEKDGTFVKEWPSTKRAAKELGLHQSLISLTALGRNNRKTTGGFIWKYKN